MMNNRNIKWFSQTSLTFKDKQYASDGYLRVALSTNTEAYNTFNPPVFNISISNQISKMCNLNIQNAEDLLESFTTALKQLNGNETIIEKNYKSNIKLFFRFAVATSTNERVVVIEIISSETDAVKIIVPLKPTFQSFLRRLRFYIDNYDHMCFQLMTKSIDSEMIQVVKQLPSLIKGISSQIITKIPDEDLLPDTLLNIEDSAIKETEGNILDLDKFIGPDMENIKISEIEEKKAEQKAPIVEIKSDLIDKVLMGDLFNLENQLTSFSVSPNPIHALISNLESSLNFKLLNGITEDDEKSIVYITTFFKDLHSKLYTLNNAPIPSKSPVIKFKGKGNDKNIELAKDIVILIGYMRTVRRRLESKVVDVYDNKAMVYMLMRYMMDPFCFSYLDGLTRTDILSSIKNRYEYFNQIGVFDRYKQILEDNRCTLIDARDITIFAEEVVDNIIGKTPTIDVLHENLYQSGNLKLPSKNTFSLEQIVNEIIPLEVNENLGQKIDKLKDKLNISDEIIKFFIDGQKVKKSKKLEKITPLRRLIDKFKQDIPESYRDDVINFVKQIEYNTFDFNKCEWPLEEFDDRIIKAFYVWDPSSDEKMKSNFEYFASLVEDEPMTKENILISNKIEKTDGWNTLSDFI